MYHCHHAPSQRLEKSSQMLMEPIRGSSGQNFNIVNKDTLNLDLALLGPKTYMCLSDFQTDSPFSHRLTQGFLLCKVFFIGDHIRKKSKIVNRTTLREVIRF